MANETQTATPQTQTPNAVAASTGANAAQNPVAANSDKFYPKAEAAEIPAPTATPETKPAGEPTTLLTDPVKTEPVKVEGEPVKTEPPVKTEEKKDAEGKPVVPEKYELKLPENSRLDKAAVDEIAAFAKAQGLSNDAAQEIVNRENKAVSTFAETQLKQVEAKRGEWFNEIKSNPELGGEHFEANAVLAKSVVDRFGDKVLKDELSRSGLGNHPALFGFTVRLGKALNMQQEKMIHAGSQADDVRKSNEEKFYGKKK